MRLGDAGQSIKHPGHAPHVLRLVAHVDLVAQECAQFVHEVERAVALQRRPDPLDSAQRPPPRTDERRVRLECVSTSRSPSSLYPYKNAHNIPTTTQRRKRSY